MNAKIKTILLCLGYLVIFIISPLVHANTLPDLSTKAQSFILEEKQIFIPGYPDAFNPSVVRWKDGSILLSFRTRDPLTNNPNLIGFVFLDENFDPVSKPTLLKIIGELPLNVSREQDPRIVFSGNHYYIVYNNIMSNGDLETRRMLLAKLHHNLGYFFIINPQYLLNFIGDPHIWKEKNWTPWDHNGELMLSYSLNPHRVLKPTLTDESCISISLTEATIPWRWGILRGGTPALLDGDEYLGFFHSVLAMKSVQSKGNNMAHYFMGAYRFKKDAPYAMTHISPEPIYGSEFYTSPDYLTWKPLKAVYPAGLLLDDNFVWVVYGRQDYECWVVKMDKQGLMDSLIPVQEIK